MKATTIDIETVRAGACKVYPYFSRGLCNITPIAVENFRDINPGGWAVDKFWRVYYDPAILAEAGGLEKLKEFVACFIHEHHHPVLDHFGRHKALPVREDGSQWTAPEWNKAADREINGSDPFLLKHLPKWACFPEQIGKENGLLAEEYLLREEEEEEEGEGGGGGGDPGNPEDGSQPDCGSGCGGESRPWELGPPSPDNPGVEPGQGEVLRELIAKDIKEHEKKVGSVPSNFSKWADDILVPPQVPWQQILHRFLRQCAEMTAGSFDFTFQRRNRRQSAYGDVILPATYQPKLEVAVVLDTSGSMSESDLNYACSEISAILRVAQSSVNVVCCDSKAHAAQRITRPQNIQIIGRGGTDMTVGLKAAAKASPSPHLLICLTDGFTGWPQRGEISQPIIAGIVKGNSWGRPSSPPSWVHTVAIEKGGE